MCVNVRVLQIGRGRCVNEACVWPCACIVVQAALVTPTEARAMECAEIVGVVQRMRGQ